MKWHVATMRMHRVVEAQDQSEAYQKAFGNTDPIKLGLIITARREGDKEDDVYACRTSRLLARWGKTAAARLFIRRAIELGLGDSSVEDLGRPLGEP